ncbi:hypothetical protein PO909_008118 [Leuciscus waleckii]
MRLLSGSSLTPLKRALSTVPLRSRAFPPVLPHKNLGDTEGALKPSSLRGVKRICGPLLLPRRLLGRSPDVRGPRTNEGSSPRSRAVNTSFYGARLSSVPSGDRSANPATSGVTGRSGLRRAHISRSTRKRSGLGMPAPSEEGARATVEKGYQIQFKKRPPQFMGVRPTVVGPEQVLVMEQEVNTLLEKGAIEYVPPSNRETGFYSRYFIVPKKDGGLRPILDLRVLNEDHFFRRGLGFCVDAGAPVTATDRFHPCSCEKCKARPATHWGFAFAPVIQLGTPYPLVVPGEVAVCQGSLHPRGTEYRSRHSVEAGAEARGMEAPPRGGGADMEGVWPSTSGSVCVSRDVSLSTLVLPHASSSSGTGCYGTDMAEATSVRLSPSGSAPGSSGKSSQGPGPSTSYSPALAGQSMVSRPCVPPRRASSGATRQEGPFVPGRGLNISPPPRTVEPVGLASEGAQLIESGLSTEVVETILQSRAPSTRKLYALKWRVFTSWCSDRRLDPVHCPIGTVLEFLQERFTAGLTPSTLKVYVAAIGAYHIPLGGMSVGKDPLVSRFLRGTWRLRPAVRSRVPPWDLSVALQGLSLAPFEPIEEVPEKFLTLKALFLLAISSLKRIGDLQALSVAPSCLEFAPGMVKAFLHPRPGYIPKVPTNVVRPVVLQAFCPPPFQNADQEANNLLCPVRALDAYVHRAALWRKSDQLFVCFGSPNKGGPVSKQRMSKWVVEAISLAYEAAGQPSPLAVRSHSTRSMAASKALISGVSLQDVCDAAGWSSPHTFVRFYSLDLDSAPGSHVLSS